MYPSVKSEIPDFIEEYVIYCDCFVDIYKQKTCWALTRNLKFFEFCRKQLVASIDLQTTCLNTLKTDLIDYKGAKSKWYETSTSSIEGELQKSNISLGKYVFHALNICKIYVIIQCWDKCVVLKRLPDFKGFEIKAEYENLQSYRIVHGTIKFCPVLELKFLSDDILKTDFENTAANAEGEEDVLNKNVEIRHLLERIRCAKTELELHKSITAKRFFNVQNNLTLGQPFLRTCRQEEKQILGRCGDIWKRFTAYDDLVIGVPLVNQCAMPNLSIVRNLKPVLQTNESLDSFLQVQYRLFQLKLKFEQLDDVETFLESEDEELQEKVWCANGDLQLLPESFAVLLIKLKISQIITLKESPLILCYEVIRHLHTTSDTQNATFSMPLQLFLQNLDFPKLLFEERQQSELTFLPRTLHQDFLTIAMTSSISNFEITFKSFRDLEMFESFLQKRLDFLKPKQTSAYHSNYNSDSVFYNNKTSSLWFGSLILRLKNISEDEENQCQTSWKIYCQNYDKILILLKTFLNDHLSLECNITSITSSDKKSTSECIENFQDALRQELLQLQEIVSRDYDKISSQQHLKNMEKLFKLQLNTDLIASDILENE